MDMNIPDAARELANTTRDLHQHLYPGAEDGTFTDTVIGRLAAAASRMADNAHTDDLTGMTEPVEYLVIKLTDHDGASEGATARAYERARDAAQDLHRALTSTVIE